MNALMDREMAWSSRGRGGRRTACGVIALLAGISVLTGCPSDEAETNALREGFAKYSGRQVEESEAIANKFIAANPTSPVIDQALYLRGLSRLMRDNKTGATEDFRAAIQKSARADLKAKAYRALGDIDYDALRWPEAQQAYQSALSTGGVTPANAAYLNFRVGACLQAQGEWAPAETWFGRVVSAKSDAALAERAVARMHATAYSLQYGAYEQRANATARAAQIRAAGVTPAITSATIDGKVLLVVTSGAFRTWREADAARDQMNSKFPEVVIIPQ